MQQKGPRCSHNKSPHNSHQISQLLRFAPSSDETFSVLKVCRYLQSPLQSFREKLGAVKHEMSYYEIPEDLQYRVQRHYDYMWLNERAFDEIKMLSDPSMSKVLRTNIALHLYKDLLQKVCQFVCCLIFVYYFRCPCDDAVTRCNAICCLPLS